MFGEHFEMNEATLPVVEEIGRHIPGGFLIHKSSGDEEIIYANQAVFDLFGCRDWEDFKQLTGGTFRGMLAPEDYEDIFISMQKQEKIGEDNTDYDVYRIRRKDGSLRWIDDYSHYTDTKYYGGIYYVFISDISEQREQMETDMAVRNAVIEALGESYHTMWLITDVEKETFSLYRGDTSGDTTHAAPIKDALSRMKYSQAKEYYINTTVAPVDRDRLQEELTMDNIVRQLKEKGHFNVNYLRTMEDGSERHFRIEFGRVNMPGGKTGVVCGFKDIEDEIHEQNAIQQALMDGKKAEEENLRLIEEIESAAKAEARVKQEELEQRVALQDQLLAEESRRAQQSKLITALASDYWSVYYLDLDKDEGMCYQSHADVDDGFKVGDQFKYLEAVTAYANQYITDQYREEFLQFIQPEAIKKALKSERVISYRYMVSRHGRETYEVVRFAGVRRPEDRDDQKVHAVGACFADIDAETRRALAQSEALSDALENAEQASKAKTAFLSNMSHEIRTPMNAIIGLNNIALNDPALPDTTREHLEKIGSSAKHLLNIINDILDMSRIESGKMTIKNEEFCFSKALEQVNTIISGQCRDKDIDYECRIKGRVEDYYIGDDMKLRQIMINILGNAVKFTGNGGHILFSIEEINRFQGKSTLQFIFRDTGIGMSEDYIPHLFDAFTQEDSSATNRYGSTGLGMPITKSIVELMNGHIEVESEKGIGTTFTVTITLTDANRMTHDLEEGEFNPHELSVLVIDDDPVACEHARIVLDQVNIKCDIAASGAEGVDLVSVRHARRDPYDLILVDWKMPEMDGVETTRIIRSVVGHDSAIIILTSYNWDDIADEAHSAGVDSFVPKPLFAATVMDEFREAFRKKSESMNKSKKDLRGRRILLAEDMVVNAEIMVMVLGMKEIDVEVAENGRIAVDLFQSHPEGYYDAILMDVRMPEMDGLEATRTIRASGRADAKTIPIIALTANAFDEDVQRSLQAGLNAHLSKPVEPDALFETLESLIDLNNNHIV